MPVLTESVRPVKRPNGNGGQAFHIVVIPEPGCKDAVRALKALTKFARRRLKLRCVSSEALK